MAGTLGSRMGAGDRGRQIGRHGGRRLCSAVTIAATLIGSSVWAAPAADDETSVVIAPVVVQGELPDPRRDDLGGALQEGLERGGFAVRPPPVDLAGCQTPVCRAQVARGVDADYAVGMTVIVDRRDYAITLEVVDASTAAVIAVSRERCDVCGFAEVRQLVDSQAAAIGSRLDALALEPPVLVFDSVPVGAVIRIDGQTVGQAPFERVVEPGAHVVRAERDGYVPEQREVEAVVGVRANVQFSLEPVPRLHRQRRLRVAGWTTLGVGVAALATGIPLMVIDGRPNRVSCNGGNVDPAGNCKFLYATLEPGIGVAVVGGLLLGTGVTLLVLGRERKSGQQARVSVQAGWSRLGVAGRF